MHFTSNASLKYYFLQLVREEYVMYAEDIILAKKSRSCKFQFVALHLKIQKNISLRKFIKARFIVVKTKTFATAVRPFETAICITTSYIHIRKYVTTQHIYIYECCFSNRGESRTI